MKMLKITQADIDLLHKGLREMQVKNGWYKIKSAIRKQARDARLANE